MSIIVVWRAVGRCRSPFGKKSEGPGDKPHIARALRIESIGDTPRYRTVGHLPVDDLRPRKTPGNPGHSQEGVTGYALGLGGVRLVLIHQVSIQVHLLINNVEHPFAGPEPRR